MLNKKFWLFSFLFQHLWYVSPSQLYVILRYFFEAQAAAQTVLFFLKLLKITLLKIIPFDFFEKTGKTDIQLYLSWPELLLGDKISNILNWNLNF